MSPRAQRFLGRALFWLTGVALAGGVFGGIFLPYTNALLWFYPFIIALAIAALMTGLLISHSAGPSSEPLPKADRLASEEDEALVEDLGEITPAGSMAAMLQGEDVDEDDDEEPLDATSLIEDFDEDDDSERP